MLSLRASALVCGVILVLIFGLATLGNLAPQGLVRTHLWLPTASKIVFLGLAIAFALAFVPLMINVVFGAQKALGNEARLAPLFKLRIAIVWTLWALMGLGTLVAVPAAIWSGAFGDVQTPLLKWSLAHSKGRLVVGIGMTVPEMRHASTFDLGPEAGKYQWISGGGGAFDFQVAASPTIFRGCRVYYITLDTNTWRVNAVHVSIVPLKLNRPALDRFLHDTRVRLRTEGWKTQSNENHFVRGRTTLHLGAARMDEWHDGEASDAGEWIATIDLAAIDDLS